MELDVLKGNFQVKNEVKVEKKDGSVEGVSAELKERMLASLGGSMVYLERNALTWDGESNDKSE